MHACIGDSPVETMKIRVLSGPQVVHQIDHFLQSAATVLKGCIQHRGFLFHPAAAEPEDHSSPGQNVERRYLLGQQDRVPQRRHQHRGADLQTWAAAAGPREAKQRIHPLRVRRVSPTAHWRDTGSTTQRAWE